MTTCVTNYKIIQMARRGFWVHSLAAILLGGLAITAPAHAQAEQASNLNISPKRVVFSGPNAASAVYIFNRGEQTVTYRVELIDRAMLPTGEIIALEELPDDAQSKQLASRLKSSASMIQFTPRRVTLEPGQSQAIRLRLLRPADLSDGEYRTTLTISALPPEDTGLTVDQAVGEGSDKLSIQAIALFGISIPIIVRQGQLTNDVQIEQASASGDKVQFTLTRKGPGSVYGDIEVREKDAKGKVIGVVQGIGVYNEIDHRLVEISLNRPVRAGEPLYLSYRDDSAPANTALAVEQIAAK